MKEAKNLNKRVIGDTGNLTIAFWEEKGSKKKAKSDDKCYNCHKLRHFRRNRFLPDRKLNRTITSRRKESWRGDLCKKRSEIQCGISNYVYQAIENNKDLKYDDNSNPKPFAPGPIRNAFMVRE